MTIKVLNIIPKANKNQDKPTNKVEYVIQDNFFYVLDSIFSQKKPFQDVDLSSNLRLLQNKNLQLFNEQSFNSYIVLNSDSSSPNYQLLNSIRNLHQFLNIKGRKNYLGVLKDIELIKKIDFKQFKAKINDKGFSIGIRKVENEGFCLQLSRIVSISMLDNFKNEIEVACWTTNFPLQSDHSLSLISFLAELFIYEITLTYNTSSVNWLNIKDCKIQSCVSLLRIQFLTYLVNGNLLDNLLPLLSIYGQTLTTSQLLFSFYSSLNLTKFDSILLRYKNFENLCKIKMSASSFKTTYFELFQTKLIRAVTRKNRITENNETLFSMSGLLTQDFSIFDMLCRPMRVIEDNAALLVPESFFAAITPINDVSDDSHVNKDDEHNQNNDDNKLTNGNINGLDDVQSAGLNFS